MDKNRLTVIGIKIKDRSDLAPEVQQVITKFGSDVICRMGVPSPDKENGLITLVMDGPEESVRGMVNELQTFEEISVNFMSI